jgi:hypothetical protein
MGREPCPVYKKNKQPMNKRQLLLRLVPFTILPVTIFSVIPYPRPLTDFITIIGNTTVWWLILSLILYVFWLSREHLSDKSDWGAMITVQLYLLWNIFSVVRGLFIAENYWDWKGLVGNAMALLIPIVAYSASNKMLLQSIITFYIKYALPLFFIFAFLIHNGAYGFYLVPISFILLFFPVLTFRWKLIITAYAILVLTADLGARSNVIKFGVPILLNLIYYFRLLLSNTLLDWVRKSLFIAPLLMFYLAVTGVFNVFHMQNYVGKDYVTVAKNAEGDLIQDNLLADTRTFLYKDVLQTAQKYNSWWIGRSPARGNESRAFDRSDMTGRGERLGNEVAVLNIFTWTGIIGVVLYFMVFYKASYMAVNQSNNIFSKILGLFIALRWLYAWVEDVNYFTLTTIFLWFMIGLCFSKSFRAMNDEEVKCWVRGIFGKRYNFVYGSSHRNLRSRFQG